MTLQKDPSAPDPLMSEDLPTLLSILPNHVLWAVVDVLRDCRSFSPFPMQIAVEARKAEPGCDLVPFANSIAAEILWWGSDESLRQVGLRPGWRDLVLYAARVTRVPAKERAASLDCVVIEQALLRHRIAGAAGVNWDSITSGLNQSQGWLRTIHQTTSTVRDLGLMVTEVLSKGGSVAARSTLDTAEAATAEISLGEVTGRNIMAAVTRIPAVASVAVVIAACSIVVAAGGPAGRVLNRVVPIIAAARFSLRQQRRADAFE